MLESAKTQLQIVEHNIDAAACAGGKPEEVVETLRGPLHPAEDEKRGDSAGSGYRHAGQRRTDPRRQMASPRQTRAYDGDQHGGVDQPIGEGGRKHERQGKAGLQVDRTAPQELPGPSGQNEVSEVPDSGCPQNGGAGQGLFRSQEYPPAHRAEP